MRNAAGRQHALELGEGGNRIRDVDDGVARDHPVEARIGQRQCVIFKQVRGNPLAKPVFVGPRPGTVDELCIDVHHVNMTGRTDASCKLDCRVPGTASEISNVLPFAEAGGGIELFGRRIPLEHRLVALHALFVDVHPVILKSGIVSHAGPLQRWPTVSGWFAPLKQFTAFPGPNSRLMQPAQTRHAVTALQ